MAITEETEALMLAYVYGELPASDARAFERRLDEDAELRAEVEGLRATRALLGRDAAFGEAHGLDAPPPHLVEAIVRAEVLERAPEVRAAVAARGASTTSGWTGRVARWLVGGGLAAAGAAAALVVTLRAPPDPLDAVAQVAPAPPVAEAKAAELAEPAAEHIEADAPAAQGAEAAAPVSRGAEAAAPEAPAPEAAAPEAAVPEAAAPEDVVRASIAASDAEGAMRNKGDAPAAVRAPSKMAPSEEVASSAAAPMRASAPAAPGLGGGSGVDDRAAKKVAAPPSSNDALADEREGVVGRAEAKARFLAEEVRRRGSAGPLGPSKDMASSTRQVELANLAYMTGQRELAARNWLVAFDEMARAEELDTPRALGAAPQLGQMQALVGLRRPGDVVRVALRLVRRPLGEHDVIPALALGAETAERTGDVAAARSLWTRLAEAPTERARARAALARLARGPATTPPAEAAPPPR